MIFSLFVLHYFLSFLTLPLNETTNYKLKPKRHSKHECPRVYLSAKFGPAVGSHNRAQVVCCCTLLTTAQNVNDDSKLTASMVVSNRCNLVHFIKLFSLIFTAFYPKAFVCPLSALHQSPCSDLKCVSIFGRAACCQKPSDFLTFPFGSL